MQTVSRVAVGLVGLMAAAGLVAGCGKAGSSGTQAPASNAAAGGCAPVAGDKLVLLDDDKHLQNADNIIAAVNSKVAKPELIAALDKVSTTLDPQKLIALNKATDIDHKTSAVAAQEFAQANNLTGGITKGAGGPVVIGAGNFSESQTLAELYKIALTAAGYTATTQAIGNRELYEPSLEKGQIQVVPEYAATLAEFINGKVNGASAAPVASPDVDKTVAALKDLGGKVGQRPERVRGHHGVRQQVRREVAVRLRQQVLRQGLDPGWSGGVPEAPVLPGGSAEHVQDSVRPVQVARRERPADEEGAERRPDQHGPRDDVRCGACTELTTKVRFCRAGP